MTDFRDFIRHARARRAWRETHCERCGQRVNSLLHIWNPFLCPKFHFGGKSEPHKDDLG